MLLFQIILMKTTGYVLFWMVGVGRSVFMVFITKKRFLPKVRNFGKIFGRLRLKKLKNLDLSKIRYRIRA